MNVIYDIRNQEQPKEFILIIFGIIMIIAFILILIRVILYFSGKFQISKIPLFLDFVGLLATPIIATMLISMNVNANQDFSNYCSKLDSNECIIVTGTPTNIRKYEINSLEEELVVFEIDGKEFDTANLYRTKNGLSHNQIKNLEESDSVTVKYIENEDANWIVYISVDN